MADWCALPEGLLPLIARRLQVIEDFIAFRATCSSWLKATTLKDFDKSCPRLPLLMLRQFVYDEIDEKEYEPDKKYKVDESKGENYCEMDEMEEMADIYEREEMDEMVQQRKDEMNDKVQRKDLDYKCKFSRLIQMKDPEVTHNRKFFSLSKRKRGTISLRQVNGTVCVGSKGWLIMVDCITANMCLFHPITSSHIPLPKAPPKVNRDIRSAVLSASPSQTSSYVVMVAIPEPPYISGRYVGFWKPGNETWTRIELPCSVEDLNYYNGKFYALTEAAQVWMCDVSGPNPNNKASKIMELPWKWSRPLAQLVECRGRLLIVAPFLYYHSDAESHHDLKMVELDVINGSYNTITSLGGSTAFLGCNEGFSIDANIFPRIIQPNSIYFGDGSYRVATRGRNHVSRPHLGWGRAVWINF